MSLRDEYMVRYLGLDRSSVTDRLNKLPEDYLLRMTKAAALNERQIYAIKHGFVPLALGVAPSVYITYNAIKAGNEFHEALKKDKNPIDFKNLKLPDRRIQLLTDDESYGKWANDPKNIKNDFMGKVTRIMVDAAKEEALAGNNAFFTPPQTSKGLPAVMVPKKKVMTNNKKVLAHELGHYQDYKDLKANNSEAFVRRSHMRGGTFLDRLIDHKTDPTYINEVKAWDNTEYGEDDEIRQKALKTYEWAAHSPKAQLAYLASLGYIAYKMKSASEDLDKIRNWSERKKLQKIQNYYDKKGLSYFMVVEDPQDPELGTSIYNGRGDSGNASSNAREAHKKWEEERGISSSHDWRSEKTKEASNDYYTANRAELLRAAKQYRMLHKQQIKKHAKAYARKVDMGMVRPKQRIQVGHDYIFIRR